MKPINIYALTRLTDPVLLKRMERQLSGREHFLKIRPWEMDGLRIFSGKLSEAMDGAWGLKFYYSFVLPKLGKEFDLIRVSEDSVVNIELKSENVTEEAIRRQLLQNRYYLASLGRDMHFFTYVSGQNRLVRLSGKGRIVDTDWGALVRALERQQDCYEGDIEELFPMDSYLISPLTDPGRFLRGEYFLTSQQRDIRKHILRHIREGQKEGACVVQGFTGLPGTGKTILLYDLAMQLSETRSVCLLHFGSQMEELVQLDARLKRVDFYDGARLEELFHHPAYSAILVDEGHRISREAAERLLELAGFWRVPVILSYDREDAIALEERDSQGMEIIAASSGYGSYRLTNRIRLNSELSCFISCVMHTRGMQYRRRFPSVFLVYAADEGEAERLLDSFRGEGYVHIEDDAGTGCREYDRVVMEMDADYYYDEMGFLRSSGGGADSRVRALFHGLSRARKGVALIVKENAPVFQCLLSVLQWETVPDGKQEHAPQNPVA